MKKVCKECGIEKEITEFYKDARTPGGFRHQCKECKNKKTVVWRENNRERYNRVAREHHKKHYQKFRLQRYNIVPQDHTDMLIAQNGVCAICSKPPAGKRPLVVDHDHHTGKVRGLLCYGCNRLLVLLDDQALLTAALAYIAKSKTPLDDSE